MAERIVITAMGICSALGDNLEEHLAGLLSGQSGLSVIEHVPTLHRDHIRVGELKHTNDFTNILPKRHYAAIFPITT